MSRKLYGFYYWAFLAMLLSSCVEGDFYDVSDTEYIFSLRKNAKESSYNPYWDYPTLYELAASQIVITKMNEAWQLTMDSCTTNGIREFGFYIYYSRNRHTIYCGEIKSGALFTQDDLIDNTYSNPTIYLGNVENNQDVCGFFHTHPSLEYFTNCYRLTGPSDADIHFANTNKMPGLLFDYAGRMVNAGQSKTSQSEIYKYGPTRRYL